jgi:hypothetical protein
MLITISAAACLDAAWRFYVHDQGRYHMQAAALTTCAAAIALLWQTKRFHLRALGQW